MKCLLCKRRFREADKVIAVGAYVTNERRGDFVGTQGSEYIHLAHLAEMMAR